MDSSITFNNNIGSRLYDGEMSTPADNSKKDMQTNSRAIHTNNNSKASSGGTINSDYYTEMPSTSTGITSPLKDDIVRLIRLQQFIIESDEDDDEYDENWSLLRAIIKEKQRYDANIMSMQHSLRQRSSSNKAFQNPNDSKNINVDSNGNHEEKRNA